MTILPNYAFLTIDENDKNDIVESMLNFLMVALLSNLLIRFNLQQAGPNLS